MFSFMWRHNFLKLNLQKVPDIILLAIIRLKCGGYNDANHFG